MSKRLKYTIFLIGSLSLMGGVNAGLQESPPSHNDFFGQFIALEAPIDELKGAIEKEQYEKALSLLEKIQVHIDYMQTAADSLRVAIDNAAKNLKSES